MYISRQGGIRLELLDSKILVVDDKKVNLKVLSSFLKKNGYTRLYFASDGEGALRAARLERPDLILLDIVMPGMDGFQVLQRLKGQGETRFIPVIMVTALEDRDSRLRALELGADDFLSKPVDSSELAARVKNLLKVQGYFQQVQESNARLLADIKTAQRIQKALLPKAFPRVQGLAFDACYRPAEYLGGDYYNIFTVDRDKICLYVADVTGHNLDAAMLTVFLKETIAGYLRQVQEGKQAFSPRQCLLELDSSYKKENFPENIFITLFIAVLDLRQLSLTYSAAGFSECPYIYGSRGVRELECPGSLIMSFGETGVYKEKIDHIQGGEGLLLYTDGLVEQLSPEGEEYGGEKLKKLLSGLGQEDCKRPIPRVLEGLKEHAGRDRFSDDIALLSLYVG